MRLEGFRQAQIDHQKRHRYANTPPVKCIEAGFGDRDKHLKPRGHEGH